MTYSLFGRPVLYFLYFVITLKFLRFCGGGKYIFEYTDLLFLVCDL
jgi:hypothetical protein